MRKQLDRFRGREIDTAGDGFLATFDGPARAVRCAHAIGDAVRSLGIEIRAGLHTGEIELREGDDIGGIAVNIGARVGEDTMVDTWATVGSCAQIGKNCHISGGAGIGGVLEPLQAGPVIIEDNCFIGARAEVAEGVVVREGSVLSMGVYLGASTKIVDRATGEVFVGEVPAFSVVVPGSLPGKPLPDGTPGPSRYCAVIVKRVDAQTRSKTSINDLLRD